MNNLQTIKDSEVYKQVLKDSMGGIMYNVANRGKYEASDLVELWDAMSESEQNAAGGIMKGAITFLKEAKELEI